jgi:hypothetical protein
MTNIAANIARLSFRPVFLQRYAKRKAFVRTLLYIEPNLGIETKNGNPAGIVVTGLSLTSRVPSDSRLREIPARL